MTRRVVFYADGPDLAGVGYNLKVAFDRYAPEWEARQIARQAVWLDYPVDILWPRRGGDVATRIEGRKAGRAALAAADVVHLIDRERPLYDRALFARRARFVVHHLGTRYRRAPRQADRLCARMRAVQVTDSIDLVGPRVSFLPFPAPLDELAELRRRTYRPSERVRIVHAPTNRRIKDTPTIVAVVHALARHYPIDFDLVERVPNRECLDRKARADIFVDQLRLGFGMNAVESWAMGVPVVSGLVGAGPRAAARETFGSLPWVDVTAETLYATLERLVASREIREAIGELGRQHAARWHSERAVVERTLAVYDRLTTRAVS